MKLNIYTLYLPSVECTSSTMCEGGHFCNFINGDSGYCETCLQFASGITCNTLGPEGTGDLKPEGVVECKSRCKGNWDV